jgi:hypothetical protein
MEEEKTNCISKIEWRWMKQRTSRLDGGSLPKKQAEAHMDLPDG